MSSAVRLIVSILLAVLSCFILLPTAIAVGRNHPDTGAIAVWNTVGLLLFGLGWFIALVKALTDGQTVSTNVVVHNIVTQENGKQ